MHNSHEGGLSKQATSSNGVRARPDSPGTPPFRRLQPARTSPFPVNKWDTRHKKSVAPSSRRRDASFNNAGAPYSLGGNQYHRYEGLNYRVRNGNGCFPFAVGTRNSIGISSGTVCGGPDHRRLELRRDPLRLGGATSRRCALLPGKDDGQAIRQISTGRLNALLHLHLRPINLVVFEVPQGISGLGVGFTLRCFQRLSVPNIATLRCP